MDVRKILWVFLASMSGSAMASGLDISLGNKTAQIQFNTLLKSEAQHNAEMRFGFFYNDVNTMLASAGLQVLSNQPSSISASAGVEVVVATIKDNPPLQYDASALALNANVRFALGNLPKTALVGELYYAPDITTFGDAKNYTKYGLRGEYDISPQTQVYLGYRYINFDIKNRPSAEPDDNLHIGVRLTF